MNKVLVVVDMQNDFITGTLGTPEAQAIVPNVVAKIQQEAAAGTLLALTQDTHTEDYLETNEGKHLPVTHCIKNSVGWKLESSVIDSFKKVWDTYEIPKMIRITKPSFGSETLMENLAEDICDFTGSERDFGKGVEIEFVGLCTGICVPSNAILAKAWFPEATISVDASCCACVTPQSHDTALAAMQLCQIEIKNQGKEPWRK